LTSIIRDTGVALITVKVDYEQGRIKAIRDEFASEHPENVGGCDFHWKQLLVRKLKKAGVDDEIIYQLM
jgi:hypothetical protein